MKSRPDCPDWRDRARWCLLDSDFASGLDVLQRWHQWQTDPRAPRSLHLVACCEIPPSPADILSLAEQQTELLPLAQQLARHCDGLRSGFQRLVLESGRVHLTLCVGETLALLRAHRFVADELILKVPIASQEPLYLVKALSRLCRVGTQLTLTGPGLSEPTPWQSALRSSGFALQAGVNRGVEAKQVWQARYLPGWQPARPPPPPLATDQVIAVIGAGLAGASVAAAFARRGFRVDVFEAMSQAAQGASGLPAGLMVAHVSRDDCALSRLSRAGIRLTLAEARDLLIAHQDWSASGVQQYLGPDAHWRAKVGHDPTPNEGTLGYPWGAPAASESLSRMHHQAGWLKPAALVRAWLAQPGVTLHCQTRVGALHQQGGRWQLSGEQGQPLLLAHQVVLANGWEAVSLLKAIKSVAAHALVEPDQLIATRGQRGQLSWALHEDNEAVNWPSHALNGSGSLIAHLPTAQGPAWLAGATYQNADEPERSQQANHRINLDKLQRLHAQAAALGERLLQQQRLQHWAGIRCTTRDHLPMAGSLGEDTGLWLSAGLGSRGISLAMLCAELVACQCLSEPLPVALQLARQLTPLRHKQRPKPAARAAFSSE